MKLNKRYPCLLVNCPELFRSKKFVKVLNSPKAPRVATWHTPRSGKADEYSDVFVTYDHGEGSDTQSIPRKIWKKLCLLAENEGVGFCIFWITNLWDE